MQAYKLTLQQKGISLSFISIDETGEKLLLFLEKNPNLDANMFLVDDLSFDAYKKAGLGKIGDDVNAMKNAKMKNPDGLNWIAYLSSAMKLAPIPKGMKFGSIPEGVLRLGGTFVIDKNVLKYEYLDAVPGDVPSISDVLQKSFGIIY